MRQRLKGQTFGKDKARSIGADNSVRCDFDNIPRAILGGKQIAGAVKRDKKERREARGKGTLHTIGCVFEDLAAIDIRHVEVSSRVECEAGRRGESRERGKSALRFVGRYFYYVTVSIVRNKEVAHPVKGQAKRVFETRSECALRSRGIKLINIAAIQIRLEKIARAVKRKAIGGFQSAGEVGLSARRRDLKEISAIAHKQIARFVKGHATWEK